MEKKMNAKEANAKTKIRMQELIPFQYDSIMRQIEECIDSGKFVLYTAEYLYPENKEKLIQEGYKVKGIYDDYSNFKISWKDDKKDSKKSGLSFWKR
jgi:hypothetical protein